MSKNNWLRLALAFHYLAALSLPWQTKLIVSPAASDYWEISIYAAWVFIWLGVLSAIPSGIIYLSRKDFTRPVAISVTAFIIAAALSSFFSVAPAISIYYLMLILSGLAFFICLRGYGEEVRMKMVSIILFSLSFQAAIGIWQFITQLSFSSTILGIAYHNAGDLGTAVVEVSDGRWLRAYGASSHPNAFGGLMALGAIGAMYLFFREKPLLKRFLAAAMATLFIGGAILSFSRAAWLALILAGAVFIWENRSLVYKRWKGAVVLTLISLSLVSMIYFSFQPLFVARTQGQGRLEEMSISDRQAYNRRGWENILLRPLLGTGLAASTIADRERDEAALRILPSWSYQPAHNYWLLAGAEGGFFFVLSLVFIWWLVIQKSRKNRLIAIPVALLVLSLFDHWLFSLPLSPAWLAFLFALM